MENQINDPPSRVARHFIVEELRRTHANQLSLLEEIDDKAETVMRLGVLVVTGITVFLTYAVRPESLITFSQTTRWLVVIGGLSQFLSFYTVLKSYGVIGAARRIEIGTELAARRSPEDRGENEVHELVAGGYRKAIRLNAQTYVQISKRLSLAALTLVLGALMYFIAIYLSVQT